MRLRTLLLALLLAALPALLAACKWEKGKGGGPAFKKSSEQVPVRARAASMSDGTLVLAYHDGSVTRIRTALGLDECQYAFRLRMSNSGSEPDERLRKTSPRMLVAGGKTHTLSGPYGCEATLAPGQECLGSWATTLQPSGCGEPQALLFGTGRLDVGF